MHPAAIFIWGPALALFFACAHNPAGHGDGAWWSLPVKLFLNSPRRCATVAPDLASRTGDPHG